MGSNAGQDVSSTLQGAGAGAGVGGPWGAAVGGLMGLAGGIMSGNKESEYEQQQKAALAADQAKRDAYVTQQEARYAPTQQKLLEEAANPSPLNYGLNLGNINEQSQKSEQRLNATMAAHGMTGSGLQGAGLQGIETGRVGELASAFNTGLQARTNLGMNLLQHYNPLGNAQFGAAALPEQMKFGAGEQALANQGMQQGFGAFGTGLAGVINGLNKPGTPGTQQPDPQMTSQAAMNNSENIGDQLSLLSPNNTGASPEDLGYGGYNGLNSVPAEGVMNSPTNSFWSEGV